MIGNLVLLTGEDDYRLIERRNYYREAFRKKYPDGEVEVFEEGHSFSDLEVSVMTPNLFGSKRLIFADGFWDADKFEAAEKSDFFGRLPDFSDLCTVMVIQPSLDKRLKFSKFLLKEAKVEEFGLMEEAQTIEWMTRFAKAKGGDLPMATARKLLARCGENCWNLSQEIQKLLIACEGKEITDELIRDLTIPHPKAVIWDFLTQLSKKDVLGALRTFQSLLVMGESVHQIFAMVVREVRIHTMIRDGIDQGWDQKTIATKTNLHPFVVQKTIPLSRAFSRPQLEDLYDQLFTIDRRLKTGGIMTTTDDSSEFELAVEKVIVSME